MYRNLTDGNQAEAVSKYSVFHNLQSKFEIKRIFDIANSKKSDIELKIVCCFNTIVLSLVFFFFL